jgi:hypothetical protein
MPRADVPFTRTRALLALVLGLAGSAAFAAEPKQIATPLDSKAFFKPDLYISSSQQPLQDVLAQLPNRASWDRFLAGDRAGWANPQDLAVWIDPRSGAATNILGAYPLIPGDGFGNSLTAATGARDTSGAAGVERALRQFIRAHADVLGIDPSQLGTPTISPVTDELWQARFPQAYQGVPVRHGQLVATISHGNLVLVGTETWGNIRDLSVRPEIPAEAALQAGYAFAEGPSPDETLLQQPKLELIPFAPAQFQSGEAFAGPIGQGYGHRLVWSFVFQRPPEDARWEMLVDARTGDVLAMQDINHYVERQFTGGVYPLTNTGICPNAQTCGTMQSNWPMPFADTGFAAPNNFTSSAGIFNYSSGTATTTLTGQYVDIVDTCGAVSNSSPTGAINLGGANNDHDCTSGGGSAGNTPASRSAFYEVNKLAEMARGWLPNNTWLRARLTTNVNLNNTCNAFWNGSSINFYRSGGGCRNTGEIAGVFDHEWGHGLDDNDAAGALSNSSEAYADINAIYRLQASCVGHGFFSTSNKGCGQTADGTGFNANEALTGAAYCATDCSGVRDTDFAKHNPATAVTPLVFVCNQCTTGSGPCGRQVHCAAAPSRQAAWDLAARDLQAAPFSLDNQTAFIVASRIFYQGSGNIGSWHSCTCGGTATGCGSTNAYMQWLAADDDNGNVNDGTPHMTALFNAFNRHGIGCSTPTPVNSGCGAGPSGAATLSGSGGNFSASLSWTSVAGATRYQVFRSEGHAGCNFGKTKIAETTSTTTTFTDTQVANGRNYYYNVVAAGASNACFGRASNCVTVTPQASATPDFTLSCSPSSVSVSQGANTSTTCTVTPSNGFNSAVTLSCTNPSSGVSCAFSNNPVPGGSGNSTLTITASSTATTGTFSLNVQGTGGSLTRNATVSLTVNPAGGGGDVFFDNFETSLGWTRNFNGTDTATTGLWERGDPEQATSGTTVTQLGTTISGVNDLVTARLFGGSAGANDVDGGTTSITSPAITLPATGTLTLTFRYYLAHLNNSSSADFLRVSVVGSTTTVVLTETGAANTDAAVWATATANISSFAGQTIRIRIEAADASGASLVEAGIDDVRITQQ